MYAWAQYTVLEREWGWLVGESAIEAHGRGHKEKYLTHPQQKRGQKTIATKDLVKDEDKLMVGNACCLEGPVTVGGLVIWGLGV